jgi:hypothetical protein
VTAQFKVGDRVHVEYDGVIASMSDLDTSDLRVLADGFTHWEFVDPSNATKLPDPEPAWVPGDVIRVETRCGDSYTFVFQAFNITHPWVSQIQSHAAVETVTQWFTEGRITVIFKADK